MHPGKKQHKLGAALSLDKWASAKVSKYDKRKVIEKQKKLKAKQVNKLKRLKKRLEAEGRLAAPLPQVGADMAVAVLLDMSRRVKHAVCWYVLTAPWSCLQPQHTSALAGLQRLLYTMHLSKDAAAAAAAAGLWTVR